MGILDRHKVLEKNATEQNHARIVSRKSTVVVAQIFLRGNPLFLVDSATQECYCRAGLPCRVYEGVTA